MIENINMAASRRHLMHTVQKSVKNPSPLNFNLEDYTASRLSQKKKKKKKKRVKTKLLNMPSKTLLSESSKTLNDDDEVLIA